MFDVRSAAVFVIQTLGSLYLLVILLRFILQLVRANFYNPFSQFIVKTTQPLLKPLRRVIPSMFGLDMSSLLLAVIFQCLLMVVIIAIKFGGFIFAPIMLAWALIGVIVLFVKVFYFAMIISVILSWVAPNSPSPAAELALQISEPVLAPFRRLLPNMGGLDISPILAFLVIQLILSFVVPGIAKACGMPEFLFGLL